MVNLRYHVVSITAVFLALAIGIAVGTTVIDKATVDTLRGRLNDLDNRIERTEERNSELEDELDATRSMLDELGEQAGPLLFDGQLTGVPVVFLVARGIDGDSLDGARRAVADAGAAVGGTLWLTERLRLDEEAAVSDLAAIVGRPPVDVDRVRQGLAEQLADAIGEAAAFPDGDGLSEDVGPGAPVEEPAILQELRASGFIDFDPPDGSSSDVVVLLPGLRLVVVSGSGAEVSDSEVLLPLLTELAATGPAPVVAAQGAVGSDRSEAEANRTVFVGPIRQDDLLRERVSTVDDLETFAGWAGLVLALGGLTSDVRGHYGLGEGADRLLPLPTDGG